MLPKISTMRVNGREQPAQRGQLVVAKAPGAARGEARGVHLAVDEAQRHRDEVGRAVLAQILEDREVHRAGGIGQPPPYLDVLGHHRADRALQEGLGFEQVVPASVISTAPCPPAR
jgi:hypothetical protein